MKLKVECSRCGVVKIKNLTNDAMKGMKNNIGKNIIKEGKTEGNIPRIFTVCNECIDIDEGD